MSRRLPAFAVDGVLFVARVAVGVVFVAHGWRKLNTVGLRGTAQAFHAMGVPAPALSAYYATFVELIGGLLLIVGAAVPLAGLFLFLDMVGALVTVHADKGLFLETGGYEYVLTLAAVSLVLAAVGGGRFSADGLLGCHGQAET